MPKRGIALPGDIEGVNVALKTEYLGKPIMRVREGLPTPPHDPLMARRRMDPAFDKACREFDADGLANVKRKVIEARAAVIRKEMQEAARLEKEYGEG